MRTSFHHQPEAQQPNFPLSVSWQADYPIFRASAAVTAVTAYSSNSPLFFGHQVIDVQSPKRRPSTTALSKKLHSMPSSIRRIIQKLEVSPDADPRGQAGGALCLTRLTAH